MPHLPFHHRRHPRHSELPKTKPDHAERVPLVHNQGGEKSPQVGQVVLKELDVETGMAPEPQSYTTLMNLVWFAAECTLMAIALIGIFSTSLSSEWVDVIQFGYLLSFGAALAVLDVPFHPHFLTELRMCIGKYVRFITRVFGKGLTLIFLGCALWATISTNVEGGFWLFLGALAGLGISLLGLLTFAIALAKSRSFDTTRLALQPAGAVQSTYSRYALAAPEQGLNHKEFAMLLQDQRGNDVVSAGDLQLIFNVLSSHPRRDIISERDLEAWATGRMVLL